MPQVQSGSASSRSSAAVELIDNAVSPAVAAALVKAGHDAVHVREYDLQAAGDDEVFDRAADESQAAISTLARADS